MKRGRPLQRGGRLRQVSEKRQLAEAALKIAAELRRRQAGGFCEGATPACYSGAHQGQHAHHVRLRSQGGGHDVENLRWLCWQAHTWVHANPAEAATLGLIARRGHG